MTKNSVNHHINTIYWERQKGDNCRIHSLNAMFGKPHISESEFKTLCEEYDTIICGLNSIQMDGFAECRSIVNYIVDKYTQKYTQLIPINIKGIHNKNRAYWNYNRFVPKLGGSIKAYFEFNKGHIWFNKYINNKWYKIDSLSGVNLCNPIKKFSNNGYMLVFEPEAVFNEIEYLISFVKINIKTVYDSNASSDFEIAFYNLYHLLNKITLDYSPYDSDYNTKISSLRLIFKLLTKFITENRRKTLDKTKINTLENQLIKSILLF
jgi:hypothetical protein